MKEWENDVECRCVSMCASGPGLAIRILCQKVAFIRDDYASTNSLLANIAGFSQASVSPSLSLALITDYISTAEREFLMRLTEDCDLCATLLPIYSVGVQVGGACVCSLHCVPY